MHESFGSFVAQVVEVTYKADKSFKVDRVVCAVDCGLAINPDVIKAQMEGGIGFALSAALHSAITLTDGKVDQSNFHDFQVLRINEMPVVEVHIVPSAEPPTGVGEPGFRRWRLHWPMRCSRRPASASATCRLAISYRRDA